MRLLAALCGFFRSEAIDIYLLADGADANWLIFLFEYSYNLESIEN